MLKKIIFLLCSVVLPLFGDGSQISLFELEEAQPEMRFFFGKVNYARSMTVSFDEAGWLVYVAKYGAQLKSDLTDARGRIIREGDILAAKDSTIAAAQVRISEAKVQEAEHLVSEKKDNFERYRKLNEKHAVSDRDYFLARTEYERAVCELLAGKSQLLLNKRLLEKCVIRAPFPCVVDEVYLYSGSGVDTAQPVMRIASQEAMQIEVELGESRTQMLDQTAQVVVYPVGEINPVTAWFQNRDIKTDTLFCLVDNRLVPVGKLSEEQKKMSRIGEVCFLFGKFPSTGGKSACWVPQEALVHEKGKHDVWKVRNGRAFVFNALLSKEFYLDKVSVDAEDVLFNQGLYRLRGIGADKGLQPYDLLALNVPPEVKSGDKVVFCAMRRLFRSGETVRVNIYGRALNSIYEIPWQAVRANAKTGVFELLCYHNRQIITVPVALTAANGSLAQIYSGTIPPGAKIICAPENMKITTASVVGLTSQKVLPMKAMLKTKN